MSEFSDANAAYLANADYAEVGSATKARSFVTACTRLILLASTEVQKGDNRQRYDENLRQLNIRLTRAEQWLSTAQSAVYHPDFTSFRV